MLLVPAFDVVPVALERLVNDVATVKTLAPLDLKCTSTVASFETFDSACCGGSWNFGSRTEVVDCYAERVFSVTK